MASKYTTTQKSCSSGGWRKFASLSSLLALFFYFISTLHQAFTFRRKQRGVFFLTCHACEQKITSKNFFFGSCWYWFCIFFNKGKARHDDEESKFTSSFFIFYLLFLLYHQKIIKEISVKAHFSLQWSK